MNEEYFKKLVGRAMEIDFDKNAALWNSGSIVIGHDGIRQLVKETARECALIADETQFCMRPGLKRPIRDDSVSLALERKFGV